MLFCALAAFFYLLQNYHYEIRNNVISLTFSSLQVVGTINQCYQGVLIISSVS